ncbi:MAG: MjaI family restriction endonuclease [Ignavibacteria bacterium]|nr:MjaI family restriction endonuclease [Ignavibacteria bacterium]
MKVILTFKEINSYFNIESPEFPKYFTPLINLANQYAQGTRPRVVGQMSNLIKEFKGNTISEWEDWYLKRNPDSIKKATEKILQMLKEFKDTIDKIDEKTVELWVKDLVIVKTYIGLRFQEAILIKGAEIMKTNYRLSTSDEEAKGIDGYIGDSPVSIKPVSYESKQFLPEELNVSIITYKKSSNGLEVDYSSLIKST